MQGAAPAGAVKFGAPAEALVGQAPLQRTPADHEAAGNGIELGASLVQCLIKELPEVLMPGRRPCHNPCFRVAPEDPGQHGIGIPQRKSQVSARRDALIGVDLQDAGLDDEELPGDPASYVGCADPAPRVSAPIQHAARR